MRYQKILWALCVTVFCSGCATIHGTSVKEKRNYINTMEEMALEQLIDLRRFADYEIKESSGYAVFSNINTHLLLISTGTGYGVVTDKTNGQKTYMKMFALGGGPGIGAKDFRTFIIFKKQEDLIDFIEGKWDFSGQFDAAAKSSEKGGSMTSTKSFDRDIITYQITEAGLVIHATLQGTKYYPFKDLN